MLEQNQGKELSYAMIIINPYVLDDLEKTSRNLNFQITNAMTR